MGSAGSDASARRDEMLLVGARWRPSATADRFVVSDPATGAIVCSDPEASGIDVEQAIDAADHAVGLLRGTPAADRRRLLRTAAAILRSRRDRIAATITSEQGKPVAEAPAEGTDARH